MASDLTMIIGKRARELRLVKDLTQQQVADAIGRTWETVSKFERGLSMPPLDTLDAIATVLGIGLAELIGDAGRPLSPKRAQQEAHLRALIGQLADADLDVAIVQVEALAKRR